MAIATALISSLFNIASFRDVPFLPMAICDTSVQDFGKCRANRDTSYAINFVAWNVTNALKVAGSEV